MSIFFLDLKAIVQYSGKTSKEGVLSWDELMAKGAEQGDQELDQRLKQVAVNRCAHLVYTSGTTGPPKAVMLSHDNLTFTAKKLNEVYKLRDKGEERNVSYLPLSHVAASMMDMFVMMQCRGATYFADKNALKVQFDKLFIHGNFTILFNFFISLYNNILPLLLRTFSLAFSCKFRIFSNDIFI